MTSMKRKDQQDATIRCLLLTSVSTCFGHHYAHLQESKGPVTAFGVLFCNKRENCEKTPAPDTPDRNMRGRYQSNATTPIYTCHSQTHTNSQLGLLHRKDITANIYVFPLVTEQHTKCSNKAFVLMEMGMMMPEKC